MAPSPASPMAHRSNDTVAGPPTRVPSKRNREPHVVQRSTCSDGTGRTQPLSHGQQELSAKNPPAVRPTSTQQSIQRVEIPRSYWLGSPTRSSVPGSTRPVGQNIRPAAATPATDASAKHAHPAPSAEMNPRRVRCAGMGAFYPAWPRAARRIHAPRCECRGPAGLRRSPVPGPYTARIGLTGAGAARRAGEGGMRTLVTALARVLGAAGGCAAAERERDSAPPPEQHVWTLPTHGVWGPEGATEFTLRSDMTRNEIEAAVAAPGPSESVGFGVACLRDGRCVPFSTRELKWVSRAGSLHVRFADDAPSSCKLEAPETTTWDAPPEATLRWGMSREEVEAVLSGHAEVRTDARSGSAGTGGALRWRSADGVDCTAILDRDRLGEFLMRVELGRR